MAKKDRVAMGPTMTLLSADSDQAFSWGSVYGQQVGRLRGFQ